MKYSFPIVLAISVLTGCQVSPGGKEKMFDMFLKSVDQTVQAAIQKEFAEKTSREAESAQADVDESAVNEPGADEPGADEFAAEKTSDEEIGGDSQQVEPQYDADKAVTRQMLKQAAVFKIVNKSE